MGRGAEFTIRLPVLAPARPRLSVVPPPKTPRSGRRVLIVEDNPDAAESLRTALELGDHEVAVAFTGLEGLELVRTFGPDVVLCDLGLPGLDGYGVARALRADPSLRHIFLVALSGYAFQEDIQKANAAGFDRHMAKPPDLGAIGKLLAEVSARASVG